MRRLHCTILILLLVTLPVTMVRAEDTYIINEISQLYTPWDVTEDVVLLDDGDYAAVANGEDGVAILDATSMNWLVPVAQVATDGPAKAVAVYDDILFVAIGDAGLLILDASNPEALSAFSTVAIPGSSQAVAVTATRAYVGYELAGAGGVAIVDIIPPGEPTVLSTVPLDGPVQDLFVRNDMLFVADGSEGLVLINVEDPGDPETLSQVGNFFQAMAVVVHTNYAYVTDMGGWLTIVDISDHHTPYAVGELETLQGLSTITLEDAGNTVYAYVADAAGFRVLDVGTPFSPTEVASLPIPVDDDHARRLVRLDDQVLLANGIHGLSAFDVGDIDVPEHMADFHGMRSVSDVAFRNNHAYVVDGQDGLRVVDLTDVVNPHEVSGTVHQLTHIKISGNHAFAIGNEVLYVLDISTPDEPEEIAMLPFNGPGNDLVLNGDYALVAAGMYGVHVIDISDPSDPELVETSGLPNNALAHAVAYTPNGVVAVSHETGLHLFDIDNFPNLTWDETYDAIDTPLDITASGAQVFVAWGNADGATETGGLAALGVTFWGDFQFLGDIDLGVVSVGVTLHSGYALLAQLDDGITAIDIDNPFILEVAGGHSIDGGNTHAIAVHEEHLFVANEQFFTVYEGAGGLFTAERDANAPVNFHLSPVYPNPFNHTARARFTVPESTQLTVELYNMLGRQVRVLAAGRYDAGQHTVTVDAAGLASGSYLLRVADSDGLAETRRITLLK